MTSVKKSASDVEYIENLVKQIKHIPITTVLQDQGVKFERFNYSNAFALCPFHPDTSIGSFSANDSKGVCKCFACDGGGNAIKSVMQIKKIGFIDAVLQIAADRELISKEEYEKRSHKKYSNETINVIKDRYISTKPKMMAEKSQEELSLMGQIYSFMAKEFDLSDAHREHLLTVRKIKEDQLNNFFTFRTRGEAKQAMIRKIFAAFPGLKAEELIKVPGFYKDNGEIRLIGYEGIGILIRNASGQIVGVQIRRDTIKEGELRYVWISSSFAIYDKYMSGGASPGSPLDVVYPQKEKQLPKICIVEGRFKAEAIAQEGNIGISVQGVGNFAGIEKEIAKIKKSIKEETVFIFYDADMFQNPAVLKQGLRLYHYLTDKCKGINVKFCCWNPSLGKGIDDYLFSGHKAVKVVSGEALAEAFSETETMLMQKYQLTAMTKLKKEERVQLVNDIKESLIQKLFKGDL